MNLCVGDPFGGCGEDFSSVKLFDAHRVGVYAYTYAEGLRMEPMREDGRRCLTVEEMIERGWEKNKRGQWFDPVEVARGVSALHRSREKAS